MQDELRFRGHLPALDGLRGIAVVLVIAYHSAPSRVVTFGWCGVDLFFVLSGFLITGILADSVASGGAALRFYLRRSLRIWPLYYLFLAFTFLLLPRIGPTLAPSAVDHPPLRYLLFINNYWYGAESFSVLGPLWSLAIEEQYYVVWPVLVWTLRRRTLLWTCAAMPLVSFALRRWLLSKGWSGAEVYALTFARLDGLAMGSALALVFRTVPEATMLAHARSAKWLAATALGAAVVCASTMGTGDDATNPNVFSWVFLLFAVGFAALLLWSLHDPILKRMLSWWPLVEAGRLSFGLYVYHLVVFGLVHALFVGHLRGLSAQWLILAKAAKWTVAYGLLVAVALASARWLEAPFLRLKDAYGKSR